MIDQHRIGLVPVGDDDLFSDVFAFILTDILVKSCMWLLSLLLDLVAISESDYHSGYDALNSTQEAEEKHHFDRNFLGVYIDVCIS